uniref:Enkurin domain-containing protein n=1 Tax=Leptocylindrus danicus TaxID=163516 RepID=A0A7S2PT63_9STRA|mmetsp:Transcript_9393/g.14129  ORF Transcript_9393/g.14129 Transcript_9393/m.14129 type:complete len:272 (+) Transcript_9393:74-889(+)
MNALETQQESIYNLVPKPKYEVEKKVMYRSKYDPNSPLVGSTFGLHGTTATVGRGVNELKKSCTISSTFGPYTKKSDSSPSNFLRKGSRTVPNLQQKSQKPFTRSDAEFKPPVPSSDERPIMGLKTNKSFITANAVDVILCETKVKNKGDVNYLDKEDYGKIPEYLNRVKAEVKHEEEAIKKSVIQKMKEKEAPARKYVQMDEGERQALIEQLKLKWDQVNSKYQKICHRTNNDTIGDIKRKEAQESQLTQLEEDIKQLSRPGPLLILQQE